MKHYRAKADTAVFTSFYAYYSTHSSVDFQVLSVGLSGSGCIGPERDEIMGAWVPLCVVYCICKSYESSKWLKCCFASAHFA